MQNTVNNTKTNEKYKRKYKLIKRTIKSLIMENAALCDEVARVQENIMIVKEERKFLLRKVMEYEHVSEPQPKALKTNETILNGNSAKPKKRKSPESNKTS